MGCPLPSVDAGGGRNTNLFFSLIGNRCVFYIFLDDLNCLRFPWVLLLKIEEADCGAGSSWLPLAHEPSSVQATGAVPIPKVASQMAVILCVHADSRLVLQQRDADNCAVQNLYFSFLYFVVSRVILIFVLHIITWKGLFSLVFKWR